MSRCEKIVSMNWQSSCRGAAQFAVRFFLRFMLWLPVPAPLLEKNLKLGVRLLAALWLLGALFGLGAAQFAVRFFLRFMLWLPVPAPLLEKNLKLGVRLLAALWLLAVLSSAEA